MKAEQRSLSCAILSLCYVIWAIILKTSFITNSIIMTFTHSSVWGWWWKVTIGSELGNQRNGLISVSQPMWPSESLLTSHLKLVHLKRHTETDSSEGVITTWLNGNFQTVLTHWESSSTKAQEFPLWEILKPDNSTQMNGKSSLEKLDEKFVYPHTILPL